MCSAKPQTMKRLFTALLLVAASWQGFSQTFNNEWINYSQTYYKFKLGKTGLYRISQAVLDASGLGAVPVENFELWRNGERVPFYPSVASGVLPEGGYIEFWGRMNDGKMDKAMYRDPAFQHTTAYSLISDTSAYFLSVNTNQSGFKVQDANNDVASNTLAAEPYFMYTAATNFKTAINPGFAAVVGEYVYSSSYDKGEFWASRAIAPSSPLATNVSGLYPYTAGPDGQIRFGAAGTALNARSVKLTVNNSILVDTVMDYFNDLKTSRPLPISLLSTGAANVVFTNTSAVGQDRMVVSFFEITYPRLFNFGGQKNFEFSLPADPDGYYLEISNFSAGTSTPVLYDLSNGYRYAGNTAVAGKIRFALPPSAAGRNFVLVNEDASNITAVTSMSERHFVQYTDSDKQGNFLIVSNPLLYTGSNGNNPVIDYRDYRRSAQGGSYDAQVYDIHQLIDQFAYGVKYHPLSVRNFILYARTRFSQPVKDVFLIGRGMDYTEVRRNEKADSTIQQLNLIPTFGFPASDNLLAANDLGYPVSAVPIGRLSAVHPYEVEDYLQKVKEYENVQKTAPNTIEDRAWMKNVVHVTGSTDPYLGTVLCSYMHVYERIIEDTSFGGVVSTFCKTTTNPVEQLNDYRIKQLMEGGISMLTYFGHSSTSTLEFNLDDPNGYNNQGKYPVFYVNGCYAGNFFTYYPARLLVNETLSEKFVLAKERGAIAFIASTHFGVVNYLNLYLDNLYKSISQREFDNSLGAIQESAMKGMLDATGQYDYYARLHAEEMTLHGDPCLKLNLQPKPDLVMEESSIKVDPGFISVADNKFSLKVRVFNIGKATADSVKVDIKRQYPDGSTETIYDQKIKAVRLMDSVILQVPVVATRDKGKNKITVTVDPDGQIDEMDETNNGAVKEFYIYEDEARPVYPYEYSIVNDLSQKLYFSTADAFSTTKDYVIEVDTTATFDSPLKVSKTINSPGGLVEFAPGISFADSTVYFWRVAMKPDQGNEYHWNNSSFIYINGTEVGYNQSHFFQHTHSDLDRMSLDTASRKWKFGKNYNNMAITLGSWVTSATTESEMSIYINSVQIAHNTCAFSSLVFNVVDPVTLKMWQNVTDASGNGLYGSWKNNCYSGRQFNFEYRYTDTASRRKMMNFMDNVIPDGYYVVVRSFLLDPATFPTYPQAYASDWQKDTTYFGHNNSIYHRLMEQGFTQVDSFSRPRQFIFLYKKNKANEFAPLFELSKGTFDKLSMNVSLATPDTLGYVKSPLFGPAKAWKEVIWRGSSEETNSADNPLVTVIGVRPDNSEVRLYNLDRNTQNFDVSAVDPVQYPYLRLEMRNSDSVTLTPYQLKYWRIYYDPVPEGAVAPNLYFTSKDSLEIGEKLDFAIAFKNISKTAFDSLKIKATILDKNNVLHIIDLPKKRPIVSGDSIIVQFEVDTKDYPENNTLFVEINPDNDQPEQDHFNNFVYRNFYVRPDSKRPMLDVTFDGVHILNRDIVSAKPHILIKLKDDAKYLLLNDTALSSVQVRFPNGELHSYSFNSDTLRFTPATTGEDNTATIDFSPSFTSQLDPGGDEYELIVKGKDRSNNKSGDVEFRVTFRIISKPMISNLLNYPNPFSTSTAFVFTLTGSEIPQNMKIQILTVTGKIVREITKDELGPIHIGRNITEFKWDGTDQFGQRLGNGVYLYRVVTTLNGKSMEKYKAEGDNTDKFFNNGYGKMYLMR